MKKILLLSCGTNACFHFAKIIKEKFNKDFYLIGADINPSYLVPSINYLDKFYKVPYSNKNGYYETVLKILKDEKADYILPSFDIDQKLFYPENKKLLKLNVNSLGSKFDTLNFYRDKKNTFKYLKENNLPVPEIYTAENLKNDNVYFIKPKNGAGSNNCRKISKKEILEIKNINDFIIQEVCTPPEITVECFYLNGRISSCARERIETKAGVCSKAKVFKNNILENIAKEFAEKFNPPLFFNLQFMKNSKNDFVITDVNLRLAGATGLSYAAGWDEVSAIANYILKKSEDEIFSSLKLNAPVQYSIRTYCDIITKTCALIAYDLDGTILNSFERHIKVMELALKKYGVKLDLSDFIEQKRQGLNNIKYLEKKGVPLQLREKIQNFWIKNIENEEFLNLDFLYPDFKIEKNSILITARRNKENCLKQLDKLQIKNLFSDIFIVEPSKNAAELKAKILTEKNVYKMYGDSETDKTACKLSGTEFIPCYHGFRNETYLNLK